MQIAYLIVAHDTPLHLHRLLKALSSEKSKIFVHIDKKSNICDFNFDPLDNVIMSKKRFPVYWGDFSQVETTLSLLDNALHHPMNFERFVLLSGVDYPLRTSSFISNFFSMHAKVEFINLVKMPNKKTGKPISRLTEYKLLPTNSTLLNLLNRTLRKIGVTPYKRDYKKYLHNFIPYGGSTWWALTRDACQYISNFLKLEKDFVKFFRNTKNPDEMFFQTILGNSIFMHRIKRNLTYNDWRAGGLHPAIISDKHIPFLTSKTFFDPDDHYGPGEFLFARKFSDKTIDLINILDNIK